MTRKKVCAYSVQMHFYSWILWSTVGWIHRCCPQILRMDCIKYKPYGTQKLTLWRWGTPQSNGRHSLEQPKMRKQRPNECREDTFYLCIYPDILVVSQGISATKRKQQFQMYAPPWRNEWLSGLGQDI